MNCFEIINKVDLKNKYGTGSDIICALTRCRSFFSRVGKEWNESNREEKEYCLVKEFERHLMMIRDSYLLTESQDSRGEIKQRVSEASKRSHRPELHNQPREKKLKTKSYDASVPNTLTYRASLEASGQIQQHQIHQSRRNQRSKEQRSGVESLINARVPSNISSNPSLIMSLDTERNTYKKHERRIQLLNNIDVEPKGRRIGPWERSFKELVSFVREFGHARVPRRFPSNPSLGMWVSNQRHCYKRHSKGVSSLKTRADRIRRLNEVGFEWGCQNFQSWNRSYAELVNFVKDFGHARVPSKFIQNPSLGMWVNTQRRSYKMYLKADSSSTMTTGRILLLNKIGFEWECYIIHSWEKSYEDLVNFVKEFGHARVPEKFPQNPRLGMWMVIQRRSFEMYLKDSSSSSMTADRILLLNKVGFEWVLRGKLEFSF